MDGLDTSQLSSLTSINMSITQPQGDQLLQTSINLLMHRRVMRRDLRQLLQQPRATIIVITLRVLESLAVMRRRLLCGFKRVVLRLGRARALHRLVARGS